MQLKQGQWIGSVCPELYLQLSALRLSYHCGRIQQLLGRHSVVASIWKSFARDGAEDSCSPWGFWIPRHWRLCRNCSEFLRLHNTIETLIFNCQKLSVRVTLTGWAHRIKHSNEANISATACAHLHLWIVICCSEPLGLCSPPSLCVLIPMSGVQVSHCDLSVLTNETCVRIGMIILFLVLCSVFWNCCLLCCEASPPCPWSTPATNQRGWARCRLLAAAHQGGTSLREGVA